MVRNPVAMVGSSYLLYSEAAQYPKDAVTRVGWIALLYHRRVFAMIANPRQRDHQSGLPRFSVTSDAYTGAAALPQEVRT